MNKKLLRKKLALMLANLKKKRRYYCEVEYLESTGTQYIDTGYEMSTGKTMTFNANIMWTQSNGNANFFYGYRSVNSAEYRGDMRAFFVYGTSAPPAGRLAIRYGVNTDNSSSTISFNQRYNISFDGTNLKVDGIYFINLSEAYTPAVYKSMWLFNCNCTGYYSSDVSTFSGRIYNWQIFEDGVLVRDMIPVLDWDMTPCMYDRVTEQLFYNQGTGDFVAGREIHYVDYLESNGTQYIDTGYAFNSNTDTIELGYQNTSTQVHKWLFGSYESNANIGISSATITAPTFWYKGNIASTESAQYNSEHILRYDSTGMSNDGVNLKAFTSYTGTWNLYLFALNNTGTSPNGYFGYGKIYSYTHKRNGSLIRDFIPAIDENGVGFMFDRVSHTCFLNAGTGVFKYPAREVEYLQSSGTQYINTGYIPNTNTECSIDFMFNTLDSTYRCPISVRTSDGAADSFTLSGASTTQNAYAFGYRMYWDGAGGCPMPVIGTKYNGTLKSGMATFGNVVGNPGTTITPTTLTAYMFARNAGGTAGNFFIGRIYDCQLKDNGIMVRDYIPCFKDGVACMVDKLTGTAYTNQGTGTFITGKIVESIYE